MFFRLSFVLCIFRVYFVDEGTAVVMNSKSIGLQMRATRHKTQRCLRLVCVSLDKVFMEQGNRHKGICLFTEL